MQFGNQSRCTESEQRNETDFHAWLVGAHITLCQVFYSKYNLMANCR